MILIADEIQPLNVVDLINGKWHKSHLYDALKAVKSDKIE
jgi:hypothetical protein